MLVLHPSLSQLYHRSTPIGPAQSHLLGPQDVPDYRKGFYEVSTLLKRAASHTLTPSLSQKGTLKMQQ